MSDFQKWEIINGDHKGKEGYRYNDREGDKGKVCDIQPTSGDMLYRIKITSLQEIETEK